MEKIIKDGKVTEEVLEEILAENSLTKDEIVSVSYTHLTLPTIA